MRCWRSKYVIFRDSSFFMARLTEIIDIISRISCLDKVSRTGLNLAVFTGVEIFFPIAR